MFQFFPDFDQSVLPQQKLSSFITNTAKKLLKLLDGEPPTSSEEWKESVTESYKVYVNICESICLKYAVDDNAVTMKLIQK